MLFGDAPETFAALTLVYHANLGWDYEREELERAFQRVEEYDRDSGWVDYPKRAAQVSALKTLLLEGPSKEPGIMQLIMYGR